jgi:uncharacterized membrane protein
MRTQTIMHVQKKSGDSHFLSSLMNVKESFLSLGHFQLKNSGNIHFWEDRWLENFTLRQQYPSLYAITRRRNVSVASVFCSIPLNIAF